MIATNTDYWPYESGLANLYKDALFTHVATLGLILPSWLRLPMHIPSPPPPPPEVKARDARSTLRTAVRITYVHTYGIVDMQLLAKALPCGNGVARKGTRSWVRTDDGVGSTLSEEEYPHRSTPERVSGRRRRGASLGEVAPPLH